MYKLFGGIIILSLLLATSCHKGGCTDPTALNYNLSAGYNDGSCRYFSDQIIGNYQYFDSITGPDINPPWNHNTASFHIARQSGNSAQFENFLQPTNFIFPVIIDSNHIVINITNTTQKPIFIGSYHAVSSNLNFSNDTIYYTAMFYDFSMVVQEYHWGYAIKQN